MIDYKIKGTVLPTIPAGTEYRCWGWNKASKNEKTSSYMEEKEMISHGTELHEEELYILADVPTYDGNLPYMFKLTDLEKLTEKQSDITMKTFTITEEQIKELRKNDYLNAENLLKSWFPEAFKPKLEMNTWYKSVLGNLAFYNGEQFLKGFLFKEWSEEVIQNKYLESALDEDKWQKATKEEITEALINEAKKRGFKKGVCADRNGLASTISRFANLDNNDFDYDFSDNSLQLSGWVIFEKGKWATITPTITKEEAEKRLGIKIVR